MEDRGLRIAKVFLFSIFHPLSSKGKTPNKQPAIPSPAPPFSHPPFLKRRQHEVNEGRSCQQAGPPFFLLMRRDAYRLLHIWIWAALYRWQEALVPACPASGRARDAPCLPG